MLELAQAAAAVDRLDSPRESHGETQDGPAKGPQVEGRIVHAGGKPVLAIRLLQSDYVRTG